MRLLLVEDNESLARLLVRSLRPTYLLDLCSTLEDALYFSSVGDYGLVILDLHLPDGDGLELCRTLRKAKHTIPILVLSASAEEQTRIAALDTGVDDYVTKPFLIGELRARLRALLRRQGVQRGPLLISDELVLDPIRREVRRGDTLIALRRKEFDLLEYLMRHQGQAISRSRLLDQIWDYSGEAANNTVDVHIKYLRDRIDKPYGLRTIRTIHGIGYAFAPETTPEAVAVAPSLPHPGHHP